MRMVSSFFGHFTPETLIDSIQLKHRLKSESKIVESWHALSSTIRAAQELGTFKPLRTPRTIWQRLRNDVIVS